MRVRTFIRKGIIIFGRATLNSHKRICDFFQRALLYRPPHSIVADVCRLIVRERKSEFVFCKPRREIAAAKPRKYKIARHAKQRRAMFRRPPEVPLNNIIG